MFSAITEYDLIAFHRLFTIFLACKFHDVGLSGSSALLCHLCVRCFFKHGISFPFTLWAVLCNIGCQHCYFTCCAIRERTLLKRGWDGRICTGVKDRAVLYEGQRRWMTLKAFGRRNWKSPFWSVSETTKGKKIIFLLSFQGALFQKTTFVAFTSSGRKYPEFKNWARCYKYPSRITVHFD